MSTDGLVETRLIYPEFRLIASRNSIQDGYYYVKSIFNGFRELDNRQDAGIRLLKKYRQLDPAKIGILSAISGKGRYSFQFTYLEQLLSQHNIVRNMSEKEREILGKHCVAIYELKETYPEYYYLLNRKSGTDLPRGI